MPKQRRAIKLQQWHIQPPGSEEPPPSPPPTRWVVLLLLPLPAMQHQIAFIALNTQGK